MLRIMAHDFDNCDNAGGLVSHSMDDKRALGIMARTVKKVGDHYSVGLLWKDDNPSLPNSRSLAEKIIVSLKCRLGKNPSVRKIQRKNDRIYPELCRVRAYRATISSRKSLLRATSLYFWSFQV